MTAFPLSIWQSAGCTLHILHTLTKKETTRA